MTKTDPRIDRYLDEAPAFAQPILRHLRRLAHAADSRISETIKWGVPYFEYKGALFGMAAFKQHCALTFWRDIPVQDLIPARDSAMGQFGQIKSLADLPPDDVLVACINRAVAHRDAPPTKASAATRTPSRPVVIPAALQAALDATPAVARRFNEMSPSQQRDYADWIAEGKSRHWKYEKR